MKFSFKHFFIFTLLILAFINPHKSVRAGEIKLVTKANSFYELTTINNILFFVGAEVNNNTDINSRREWIEIVQGHRSQVWKYQNNQLTQITNIQTNDNLGFNPLNLFINNNTLYFTGESNEYGKELWSYNEDKLQIIDVVPGKRGAAPDNLIKYKNELHFTSGKTLFRYDGSNLYKLGSMPKNFYKFSPLHVFHDKIFFVVRYTFFDGGLRSFDGQKFKPEIDVLNSKNNYYQPYDPDNFIVLNDELLFHLEDGHYLWKFDGEKTSLVMDIINGFYEVKDKMIIYQNELFFRADDGIHGFELWKYDGRDTSLIVDLAAGRKPSNPTDLTIFNNQLYFVVNGQSIWKYDGNQVSKIILDEQDRNLISIRDLVATDDALYFVTDGKDVTEEQLWKLIP